MTTEDDAAQEAAWQVLHDRITEILDQYGKKDPIGKGDIGCWMKIGAGIVSNLNSRIWLCSNPGSSIRCARSSSTILIGTLQFVSTFQEPRGNGQGWGC
jgi:hypothetical protein